MRVKKKKKVPPVTIVEPACDCLGTPSPQIIGEKKEFLLNLWRRTVNLRRPERARNEGTTGPKRLDDTRRRPNHFRQSHLVLPSEAQGSHSLNVQGYLAHKKLRPLRTLQ